MDKKDNSIRHVLNIIVILFITMLLVSGGTFAFLLWRTSDAQRTGLAINVNEKINMHIENPYITKMGMYPTNSCTNEDATMSGVSLITIENQTGVIARPNFKLKVKITDVNGTVITNEPSISDPSKPNRYYINYAVTEVDGDCTKSLFAGRFDQNVATSTGGGWYNSAWITKTNNSNGFPLVSNETGDGLSFNAAAYGNTTHEYKVWAWIDSSYTVTVIGNQTVTDPMQDARIEISWSEDSTVEQIHADEYAVYSADDNSLRFYKSDTPITAGSTYAGRTVTNVYTGFETQLYNEGEVPWGSRGENTKLVVFEDEIAPISTAYWFYGFEKSEFLDVSKLNTESVIDMTYMFHSTGSNIDSTNASGINYNHEIDNNISFLNNNSNNPVFIDESEKKFTIIGLEKWDVSSVKNMGQLFYRMGESATSFSVPNIANWNVSNVTDMTAIFSGMGTNATNSWELNLSNWNTYKVVSYEAPSIPMAITMPEFYTSYAIYSNTDKSLRFYRTTETITEGSTYKGRQVTKKYTNFENLNATNPSPFGWYTDGNRSNITTVVVEDKLYPNSISWMFYGFNKCTYFDLTNLNIDNVTSFRGLFNDSGSNTGITTVTIMGIENWDTSRITDMGDMFQMIGRNANTVIIGDLSKWDVSNVTNMAYMFAGAAENANSFRLLGLENWDTSKVTNMSYMFDSTGAKSNNFHLDLSRWKVTQISNAENFNSKVENKIISPIFNN